MSYIYVIKENNFLLPPLRREQSNYRLFFTLPKTQLVSCQWDFGY